METAGRDEISRALRRIDEVLWREWDPTGVGGAGEARDEYSTYVPGIFRLLDSGASDEEIVRHLASLEMERMGLPPRPDHLRAPVVRALGAVGAASS